MVAVADVDSIRQLHHRDHSERRYFQTLRQRLWLRDRHDFVAIYILADSWIWQCAIPRRTAVDPDGLEPILLRPVWPALFVEGRDAFARFLRFARLEVMLQRKIDIFLHRRRPKFFDQTFGLGDRVGRALQN